MFSQGDILTVQPQNIMSLFPECIHLYIWYLEICCSSYLDAKVNTGIISLKTEIFDF